MTSRAPLVRLARGYLGALLAGAAFLGPWPHAPIALALLALQGLGLARPWKPVQDLGLSLGTLLLVPFLLEPLVGPLPGALLIALALPVLDQGLQGAAPLLEPPPFRSGRRATPLLSAVGLGALSGGLLGIATEDLALLAAAGVLLLYLSARLGQVLWGARQGGIGIAEGRLRALAGSEGRVSLQLEGRTPFPLRVAVSSPHSWLRLAPVEQALGEHGGRGTLDVTAVPPLAGPGRPALQLQTLDPWGLLWTGALLTPLELHVTPRAAYAAWLARRYLERAGAQLEVASLEAPGRLRGTEFYALREYQPGDRLREIEWRHTIKFQEMVVQDHRDPQAGTALLLINLSVASAEEADWVGYNVIMAALTGAGQGVSLAVAAYDHRDVVQATPFLHAREALQHALRLSLRVVVADPGERVLVPPSPLRLRRSLHVLEGDGLGQDGTALGRMILLELRSLEGLARDHPATRALQSSLRKGPTPTTVVVISRWNHDAEALAMALARLRALGCGVVDLGGAGLGSGPGTGSPGRAPGSSASA